jgi:hypothetical protein
MKGTVRVCVLLVSLLKQLINNSDAETKTRIFQKLR